MKNKRKSFYLKLLTLGFAISFGLLHYWIFLVFSFASLLAALYYLLEPDKICIGGKYRMKADSEMAIGDDFDPYEIYTVIGENNVEEKYSPYKLWLMQSDKDGTPVFLFTYELEQIEK